MFIFQSLYSQNIVISGIITDSLSGENIIGVNVIFPSINKTTISNDYGFYSITIPKSDSVEFVVKAMNYRVKRFKIASDHDEKININLVSEDIAINKVTIIGEKNENQIGANRISVKTAKLLPSIGSENDIMKIYQLLPGVVSAENKSSLIVRGGSDDQNLIIIDGVPLYYVNHLGGFVSVFNTDAIKDVVLIKGGFPAHYGNRLSSVFDVRLKDGNMKKYEKNLSIGLISSNFSIEGPVLKNKSSFIVSVRRFNLDLLSRPLTFLINNKIQFGYNFYDLNFKINNKFNDKDRIFFNCYIGDDKNLIYAKDDSDYKNRNISEQTLKWGNRLFALRFNHIFSSKLFSNTTLSYTKFRNMSNFENKQYDNNKLSFLNQVSFYSGIQDLRLNSDFQYFSSDFYKLRTGANLIYHTFIPGTNNFLFKNSDSTTLDTTFNNIVYKAFEFNYYIENKFEYSNFEANLGLRFNFFYINKEPFFFYEPRINIKYNFNKNISACISFSKMNQNIHLLTFIASGIPLNIWIPSNKIEIPASSYQYSLGCYAKISEKINISVETYYKKMTNLTTIKNPSTLFSPNQNYRDYLADKGIGIAYGIELLIQKQFGKFSGWFSYAYSHSTRQFEEINRNKPYNFEFDRPNSLSIVGAYTFNKYFSISADWQFGTGFPYTFTNQEYNLERYNIYFYDVKNGQRMQNFHRLDISLKLSREKKNKYVRTWSFDVYNVYDRHNASYYIIKKQEINNVTVDKLYKVSLFPIIPSVSYSLKF